MKLVKARSVTGMHTNSTAKNVKRQPVSREGAFALITAMFVSYAFAWIVLLSITVTLASIWVAWIVPKTLRPVIDVKVLLVTHLEKAGTPVLAFPFVSIVMISYVVIAQHSIFATPVTEVVATILHGTLRSVRDVEKLPAMDLKLGTAAAHLILLAMIMMMWYFVAPVKRNMRRIRK